MPATKRQLRIDEDIQGFGDDQLLSLIWMGVIMLDDSRDSSAEIREKLVRRMEMFRNEASRRNLLDNEMLAHLDERIERI